MPRHRPAPGWLHGSEHLEALVGLACLILNFWGLSNGRRTLAFGFSVRPATTFDLTFSVVFTSMLSCVVGAGWLDWEMLPPLCLLALGSLGAMVNACQGTLSLGSVHTSIHRRPMGGSLPRLTTQDPRDRISVPRPSRASRMVWVVGQWLAKCCFGSRGIHTQPLRIVVVGLMAVEARGRS